MTDMDDIPDELRDTTAFSLFESHISLYKAKKGWKAVRCEWAGDHWSAIETSSWTKKEKADAVKKGKKWAEKTGLKFLEK